MDITEGGGGIKLFQKFWGSFEVDLRYFLGFFKVVPNRTFFLNLPEKKLPHGCPKQVGGWERGGNKEGNLEAFNLIFGTAKG